MQVAPAFGVRLLELGIAPRTRRGVCLLQRGTVKVTAGGEISTKESRAAGERFDGVEGGFRFAALVSIDPARKE
jgi:hypothetical protein